MNERVNQMLMPWALVFSFDLVPAASDVGLALALAVFKVLLDFFVVFRVNHVDQIAKNEAPDDLDKKHWKDHIPFVVGEILEENRQGLIAASHEYGHQSPHADMAFCV